MSDLLSEKPIAAPTPQYPRTILIAGIIWIILGSLMLLMSAMMVVARGWVSIPQSMTMLFGIASVNAGVQGVRGTGRNTFGNGIGSILFGLLVLSVGIRILLQAIDESRTLESSTPIVVGGFYAGATIVAACGFLSAGVLALVGRERYRSWRRIQKNIKTSQLAPSCQESSLS